jgi:hypothetical protein
MGMAKKYAEEVSARGFGETGVQAVCLKCILDDSLREETRQHLGEWECTFCGATADEDTEDPIALPFDDFMNIIMGAVHFLYSSPEASLAWGQEDGDWIGGVVLGSTDVAYDVCGCDVTEKVVEAIAEAISEQERTSDDISQLRPDEALRYGWEAFRDKVKYSSRFVFLSTAEESSDRPDEFTTAELLQKLDKILRDNDTLLPVRAGRTFWRGRLTDDPYNAHVWNNAAQLGPSATGVRVEQPDEPSRHHHVLRQRRHRHHGRRDRRAQLAALCHPR